MKLIVSDFDGTFFDNNYDKNIELINKYSDDFVIATGRNIKSLKKDLKIKPISKKENQKQGEKISCFFWESSLFFKILIIFWRKKNFFLKEKIEKVF